MIGKFNSNWKALLADPGPDGHIVQLYQDDEFYCEAISHFTAEGLLRNESIILVPTEEHWKLISRKLKSKGFEIEALQRRNQLTVVDADLTLPKFLDSNLPDAKKFKEIARLTIEQAHNEGKFPRIRWWGEMVNVLYVNGNSPGSTRLEELFDEVAHEETIAIFCSFLMDKFDSNIYDGPLGDVCRTHANLIPAADYHQHRDCVDAAVEKILGQLNGPLLRSLLSSKAALSTGMPPSQALLIGLKEAQPDKFELILKAAKEFEKVALEGRRS